MQDDGAPVTPTSDMDAEFFDPLRRETNEEGEMMPVKKLVFLTDGCPFEVGLMCAAVGTEMCDMFRQVKVDSISDEKVTWENF